MTELQARQLLDSFKRSYAGERWAYLGGYKGECLSLAKLWVDKLAGGTVAPSSGNGRGSGYYTNYAKLAVLQRFFTAETFVPGKHYPAGSLVVFSATSHIAIFDSAGSPTCTVFEQNADPDGSATHTAQRSNAKIDGILVLRTDAPVAPTQGAQEMIANETQARQAYALLRPNGGGSDGEISGTAGKRTWAQFANDAAKELQQRNDALRLQAQQVTEQATIITQQGATINELAAAKQQAEIDRDNALLRLEQINAESVTDTPAEAPPITARDTSDDIGKATLLAKFFALMMSLKKK